MDPDFWLVACLSVTLRIVDLWQYYACCTRSDVNRCTLFLVLYLGRMCQSGLQVVLWPHIGFLMHLLAAEPRSTAGLLFPSQYLSGTILVTVFDGVGLAGFKSRANSLLWA